MFEQLEYYFRNRLYTAAAAIFSPLAPLMRPFTPLQPDGFYNASIRVIPLDGVLRVFIAIDDRSLFEQLPGDISEEITRDTRLLTRRISLPPSWLPQFYDGIHIDFLHAVEIVRIPADVRNGDTTH